MRNITLLTKKGIPVSYTHLDVYKRQHIHATIVPIVTGERRKARQDEQNGKKKYRKKNTQDVRPVSYTHLARHQQPR